MCEARDGVLHYLKVITFSLTSVQWGELKDAALAGTLGAGTLVATGSVLLAGPVVLGRHWLMRVLWIFALIGGAFAATIITSSAPGSFALGWLGLEAQSRCLAELLVVLVGALFMGSFAQRVVHLAVFASSFLATFYALQAGTPLLVPILSEQLHLSVEQRTIELAVVGTALIGGFLFASCASALLDAVCALLGALLVAHGGLELAQAGGWIDSGLAATLNLARYSDHYTLAFSVLLFLGRLWCTGGIGREKPAAPPRREDSSLIMR